MNIAWFTGQKLSISFPPIAMGHSVLFHKTQGCSPWDSALKNSATNPHLSAAIAELSQAVANNTIIHKKLIPNEK